jgi:predicted Zn-dependent peptidase
VFEKHTLPNGLEIVAEVNPDSYSSALGFFVRTGARDETDDVAGVSHFLEHMVFKGTPTRTAEDVNREFDEMGAHYNAFTSEEHTVYYAAILPEFQDRTVALLGDILRPSLRQEDFDTEKQVIIEEIKMYDDQPPYGADDKCRAAFFGRHALGKSVLGTVDSIAHLPVDAMRAYFERRYAPGNIKLVAAGKIDFDALVRSAERYCGQWPAIAAAREIASAEPSAGFTAVAKPQATQEYVVQLAAAPSATDPLRYAAKLVATILGDDTGSRLYWELVDPGRAENASLSHHEYQGAGLFLTYLACTPENIGDNLQRVLNVYRQAESEGFTAAELDQAQRKIRSRIVLSSERPRSRLFSVGINWLHRERYISVRDDLDAVSAITLDDLTATLRQFPVSRSMTIAIGPVDSVRAPQ